MCLAAAAQVVGAPALRGAAPQAPAPRTALGVSPADRRGFELCEHLGLISAYSVRLRARRVLSSWIVHLAAFQLMSGFPGALYSRIVGEPCVSRSGSCGLHGGS